MDETIEKRIQRFVHGYRNDELLVLPQYGVYDYGILRRIYHREGEKHESYRKD